MSLCNRKGTAQTACQFVVRNCNGTISVSAWGFGMKVWRSASQIVCWSPVLKRERVHLRQRLVCGARVSPKCRGVHLRQFVGQWCSSVKECISDSVLSARLGESYPTNPIFFL
jgi:hypothetical protein